MREGRRSLTAEGTAQARALHRVLDAEPTVFDDPWAASLLGLRRGAATPTADVFGWLRRAVPPGVRRVPVGSRRLRAQLVTRSRYAEDRLEEAMERGVAQYVILAAGLDSFALRRPDLVDRLRVYEVDHPATQAGKRERMSLLSAPTPGNLDLVPFDFEREGLGEALARSTFDPERPAFFSWLGASYYLSRPAIRATFAVVAAAAVGSELVFDYWNPLPRSVFDRALLDAIRFGVAGQGEPMHSFFRSEALAALVEEAGLEMVENLDADAIQRSYLSGRRDGLVMPGFAHLARVAVR